jgi:phosphatidylserine/phosphatidylglycerophosphate/cardiolipin synthase-like enzyme
MKQAGNQLEALAGLAQKELLLVAPFVKRSVLRRVLSHVRPDVAIQIVTRWRVDEIAAGVSDLDIWLLVTDRPNTLLWLRSDLHAKYYRADRDHALVGSANLTNAALGWSQQSNLELLIESPVLTEFEVELFRGTVQVDESIYQHIRQIIDEIPKDQLITPSTEPQLHEEIVDELNAVSVESWLPSLRHPENLYVAYQGKADQLGTGSRIAAESDLQILNVPPNLERKYFDAYVGVQLLHMPIVRKVDEFVEEPQRFGSVRNYLRSLRCAEREGFDADIAWQTLMRWMKHFMPNHSEVFRKKQEANSTLGKHQES